MILQASSVLSSFIEVFMYSLLEFHNGLESGKAARCIQFIFKVV
jgi:hypothetical protein